MRALVGAALAAIFVQPLVFILWVVAPLAFRVGDVAGSDFDGALGDLGVIFAFVLLVASAFVALLGVPIFYLLRRLKRATAPTISLVGFLIGAAPVSIFAWPLRGHDGYSSGGTWHGHYVDFVVNGSPTLYGWLSYLEGLLQFGIHGCIGAVVFLLVWRKHA